MTRRTAARAAETAAFVDAVATGVPIPDIGHDGLIAPALAEAAIRSVGEHRAAGSPGGTVTARPAAHGDGVRFAA